MKICIVNHKPVDNLDGGSQRILHIIESLVARGHEVNFVYWGDGKGIKFNSKVSKLPIARPRFLKAMHFIGDKMYHGLGGAAMELLGFNYPGFSLRACRHFAKCDVVQVEHVWSALFPLLICRTLGIPSILDDHNAETFLARQLASLVGSPLGKIWFNYVLVLERVCCELADHVVVPTEQDRINIIRIHGLSSKKITVIPCFTGSRRYVAEFAKRHNARERLGISDNEPVIAFVGRASYLPNRIAIEYIVRRLVPEVLRKVTNAHFLIISRDLSDSMNKIDRVHVIHDEDGMYYIGASDICIAPMQVGAGISMKVLTYLAAGKAVVASPVAVQGLPNLTGNELVISELNCFPRYVAELIANHAKRRELEAVALQYIHRNFENSLAATGLAFEHVYRKVL